MALFRQTSLVPLILDVIQKTKDFGQRWVNRFMGLIVSDIVDSARLQQPFRQYPDDETRHCYVVCGGLLLNLVEQPLMTPEGYPRPSFLPQHPGLFC
jgi:hypothetical protein